MDTEFTCNNGQCVAISAVCNGNAECADFSDERNCPTRKLICCVYNLWLVGYVKYLNYIYAKRSVLHIACAAMQCSSSLVLKLAELKLGLGLRINTVNNQLRLNKHIFLETILLSDIIS